MTESDKARDLSPIGMAFQLPTGGSLMDALRISRDGIIHEWSRLT